MSLLLATAGGEPTVEGEVKLYEVEGWKLIGEMKKFLGGISLTEL